MLKRIILVMGLGATAFLFFFINGTRPASVGPLGILVVFLCFYLVLFSALSFLIWATHKLSVKIISPLTVRSPPQPLSFERSYYFSSIIALGPVMLVAMQSVGRVGPYDVGLIVLFMIIGCVYIAKRTT